MPEATQEVDDGGPAFPQEIPNAGGMSLLDYFAAHALCGMHARDSYDDGQATPQQRARLAYHDAVAMLAARKEQPNA